LQLLLGRVAVVVHRDLIVTLAAWHKMPAVYYRRNFVIRGGLISYGYDLIDQYRRAAGYVASYCPKRTDPISRQRIFRARSNIWCHFRRKIALRLNSR